MSHRFILPLLSFAFVAFLPLTGCAPVPVNNPEVSSASQQQVGGENPAWGSKGSTSGSSLEAFRMGKGASMGPLKVVYFDFDSYSLRSDAREILKANASWLEANPSVRAEVEGHADERGTNEYNLALGAKRAQAVRDYLVTLGISTDRLSSVSYGEEIPVCREKMEECWQRNRRAHFATITVESSS